MNNRYKTNVNERMLSTLANSGRAAGDGINSDKYDEESGNPHHHAKSRIHMFSSDYLSKKERDKLNGPVILVQPAKNKSKEEQV